MVSPRVDQPSFLQKIKIIDAGKKQMTKMKKARSVIKQAPPSSSKEMLKKVMMNPGQLIRDSSKLPEIAQHTLATNRSKFKISQGYSLRMK